MSFSRKFCGFFMAILLVMSFSGCGQVMQEDDTITVWLVGSEGQARTVRRLGRKFEEKTGISVRCEALSWGDAHSKYLTSIAGGVSPDIGSMGLTWGMEFGELGALVDLKERFPEDVALLEEEMFQSLLEATSVGESSYGIPFDLSQMIVYYRTDIVSEPPKDWDEFIAVLEELQEQNKGAVIDWGSLEWIGFSPFLWQAGGSYFNEDMTKATLNTPEAAEALDFFAKLYKTGVPRTQVPLVQGMRTGDYPLAISGNWQTISLQLGAPEIEGKWSIATLPAGPSGKRTTFIGGRILSIFSRSGMQEEAWEFIKFLSKPENQLEIYEDSLDTEDAYLPPMIETWEMLPLEEELKEVLMEQAQDAKGPPAVRSWDSSTRHVNYAVQKVILRDSDSAEELRRANKEIQRELDMVR